MMIALDVNSPNINHQRDFFLIKPNRRQKKSINFENIYQNALIFSICNFKTTLNIFVANFIIRKRAFIQIQMDFASTQIVLVDRMFDFNRLQCQHTHTL